MGGRSDGGPAQMDAVGIERPGHLGADQLPHPLTGDRSRQPGQQPAVGERVVGRLAEVPADRGRGDPFLHVPVVEQLALTDAAQVRQPGPMTHDIPDGELRLTVGGELRPVLAHGGVVVDQAAVSQPMDDCGGHSLGGRKHHGCGIGLPVPTPAPVRPPGPDIDDGFTVEIHRQRAATAARMRELRGERPDGAGETWVGSPLNTMGQLPAGTTGRGHRSNLQA